MVLMKSKTYSLFIFSSLVYLGFLGCAMWRSTGHAEHESNEKFTDADLFYKIEDVIKKSKNDKMRLVVVGHSMGTFLAFNYAITHPEQVERLILINAPMKTDEESLKKAIGEASSQLMVTMTFSKTWGKLVCKLHELVPSISYPLIRVFEPDLPPAITRAAGQLSEQPR